MSIELTDKQKPFLMELIGHLQNMEACMATNVNHNDLNSLTAQLASALSLLAHQGRVVELAVGIFDWAKGQAVDVVKNDDLKHEVLKMKLSGLLSAHSARFDRAERTVKALTTYVDGLRTLISAEKELSKNLG